MMSSLYVLFVVRNDIHIIILDKDTLEWSAIKSVIDNAGLVQLVE